MYYLIVTSGSPVETNFCDQVRLAYLIVWLADYQNIVLKYCTVELRRSIVCVTQYRVWDWNQCTEIAN